MLEYKGIIKPFGGQAMGKVHAKKFKSTRPDVTSFVTLQYTTDITSTYCFTLPYVFILVMTGITILC
jgi:hypothetical protein